MNLETIVKFMIDINKISEITIKLLVMSFAYSKIIVKPNLNKNNVA